MNGNEELAKALEKLNIDLVSLVAETSIWATPEYCEQLKRETGSVAYNPQVRRGKTGEQRGSEIDGIKIDDNTYANTAIKRAVGLKKEDITDYAACHIWADTCYDERYHTAIPNLVLIPRAIAGLSDHSEQIINVLKYRSYELYNWHPEESEVPQKPDNYPTNWIEPFKNNVKITKQSLKESEEDVSTEEAEEIYLEKNKQEIQKVKNRIPRWFRNADHINSTILANFMRLRSQSRTKFVSKDELYANCNLVTFIINFSDMSSIRDHGHGKVFEVDGDEVRLWEPVEKFINDEWNKHPELH
jgi:RNA processing factor Prp31